MSVKLPGTAQEPLVVRVIRIGSTLVRIATNWGVNDAGSAYILGYNRFVGVPANGDTLGLVKQLVTSARRKDAGITQLYVDSHLIQVYFTQAVSPEVQMKLIQAALLRAGCGPVTIN